MVTNTGQGSVKSDDRPSCSGEWLAGSGGHRTHAPCGKPADWWHPDDMWSYCDEHMVEHDRKFYVRWGAS